MIPPIDPCVGANNQYLKNKKYVEYLKKKKLKLTEEQKKALFEAETGLDYDLVKDLIG